MRPLEDKFKSVKPDLAAAKRYIRASGNCNVARSYFKDTRCSVENTEIESKGLYCLEKLARLAFIQAMQDDPVLGTQDSFVKYINGLIGDFEKVFINDWQPEKSAARIYDFMVSFYNLYSYQWKRHGRSIQESSKHFLEIMRGCLDYGYSRLDERFEALPEEIKSVVNKAFFLTNERIDEWYKGTSVEISAA